MWCLLPQREDNLPSNAGHATEITEQVSPHHLPHLTPLCYTTMHHNEFTLETNLTIKDLCIALSSLLPVSSNQRATLSEINICSKFVLLCVVFL